MTVPFTELIDLANEKVGGFALATNDDFFAPKENLLKSAEPIFIADKYTDNGKWMDGWESRRKRGPGHDWCVVRLGLAGKITGVNVDTSFFTGNYPEYCSIEACSAPRDTKSENLNGWKEILPKSKLQGGTSNFFSIANTERFTHLRLNIFPDGGVARLRVHGVVIPDKTALKAGAPVDLAAAENGGTVITCADMFFGPKDNLILPGRAENMGGGWETRRRRGPGHDWIIVKLGMSGKIRKVEVDTNHFKGNFPESCSLEGCSPGADLLACDFRDRTDISWKEILPRTKLQAHTQHVFESELAKAALGAKYEYVRLNIFPDGGISRLRVYGDPA
jgi:allantoicase